MAEHMCFRSTCVCCEECADFWCRQSVSDAIDAWCDEEVMTIDIPPEESDQAQRVRRELGSSCIHAVQYGAGRNGVWCTSGDSNLGRLVCCIGNLFVGA